MAKKSFVPYKNEEDCLQIDDLTIENRLDRVSMYGNIDITLDKEGLAIASQLKSIVDLILVALRSTDLPDHIQTDPVETVKNPFV